MKRTGVTTCSWLATLALTTLIWAAPAGAQSQSTPIPDRDSDLTRQQMAAFDQFLDNHPEVSQELRSNPSLVNSEEFVENHPALQQYLQQHPEVREDLNQNPNAVMRQEQRYDRREDQQANRGQNRDQDRDLTRQEVYNVNSFLDSHPEIEEQVRKDPSLLTNQKFVSSHPELQQFLAGHPQAAQEIRENPAAFMAVDNRFDARQDTRGRSAELANLDRFLDSHPEIAEQVRKNPSLLENNKWVAAHQDLQTFLSQHPQLHNELMENPNAFMSAETRYDQREGQRQFVGGGDRDVNRAELANMDRFMDAHPEIGEQLRKNPSLVDDKHFVNSHPELREFLASHPGVRQEYKENPNAFMQQEQRFDRRQDSNFGHDRDVTGGELSSFHEFLEGHGNIAGELSKNPALAKNQEYLENHAALQTYLQSHPQVKAELNEHPDTFFKSAQTYDATKVGVKGTTKLPTDQKWK